MSTRKVYPWQQVSDDILGLPASFEEPGIQLNTAICEGLLTGQLQAVTIAGIPFKLPLKMSDLRSVHVSKDDLNNWLHLRGFRLTWLPSEANVALDDYEQAPGKQHPESAALESGTIETTLDKPKPATDKGSQGSEKRWDDAKFNEMLDYEKKLKDEGVRNFAQQTAKHFGVCAARIRQVKRNRHKTAKLAKNSEAFSATQFYK
jgi:hypothetical protein